MGGKERVREGGGEGGREGGREGERCVCRMYGKYM